jgi:hypothetical protein
MAPPEPEGLSLFVDDVRNPPPGWTVCRTVALAKSIISTCWVARVSLDHDFDCCPRCHGDVDANGVPVLTSDGGQADVLAPCRCDPKPENGLDLAVWLVQNPKYWPTLGTVTVHSANVDGAAAMRRVLDTAPHLRDGSKRA